MHHDDPGAEGRITFSLSRSVSASRHAPAAEAIGAARTVRGIPVLRGVNLRIERGSVLGLAGPPGSGKSTLARCLAGLESLDGGRILIDGDDLAALTGPARRRRVARIQLLARDPGPGAITRALAMQPQLLILDDSLAGLDAETCERIMSVLLTEQREHALAALIISRDIELLARVVPELAVMQQGTIVEQGTIVRRYIANHTRSA